MSRNFPRGETSPGIERNIRGLFSGNTPESLISRNQVASEVVNVALTLDERFNNSDRRKTCARARARARSRRLATAKITSKILILPGWRITPHKKAGNKVAMSIRPSWRVLTTGVIGR